MNDVVEGIAATAASGNTVVPHVSLECECSSVLNFAMEQNGVPLVREIVLVNDGTAA